MKVKRAGTEVSTQTRLARRLRALAPAALALAVALAIAFTAAFFTDANSRADGPPDLGSAFTLPFKLEQGRPAPAPASPGAQPRATIPAPAPTPSVLESNQAPDPPTGVNAYPRGHSVIEIEWDLPEGDVDGFEVQVSEDEDGPWRRLASKSSLTDPAGRLYTWTQQYGLQGNQTRHYQVRAGSGENWSAWSASVSATTLATSSPSLSVEALGETSVKISWEMPSVYATVTGWDLEVTNEAPEPETISFTLPIGSPGGYLVRPPRTSDNRTWTRLAAPDTLTAETRTYTHTGLEPGDTRYYRVRAVTDVGTAAWSGGDDHATTPRGAIPAAPRLSARANGQSDIILTWTRGDGPNFTVTKYHLEHSYDGEHWEEFGPAWPDDTYATHLIDKPGYTRYYRIRAESDGVFGPWSRTVNATTDNGGASKPVGLQVAEVGAEWVELTWDAPEQVGDSPITGYQVQRWRDDIGDYKGWSNVGSTSASTLTFRDTGLKSGEDYSYQVAARDREGLGPWAKLPRAARTNDLPPPAPRLTARAGAFNDDPNDYGGHRYEIWIELSWTEPKTIYSGSRNFDYQLERSPNGMDSWEIAQTDAGSDLFVENDRHYERDLDVGPGETWYYRIRATNDRNEGGYGPWSNAARVTTMVVAPWNLPYMRAEAQDHYHIELSWEPPEFDGGSAINGYEIQVSTEGHRDESKYSTVTRPSASVRTYTHRSLQPDTEYCYRFRARNSAAWSDWQRSAPQPCFRTRGLVPAAPNTSVRSIESTGIEVWWSLPDSGGLTITGFAVEISHDGATWRSGGPGDDDRTFTLSYDEIRDTYLSGLEFTRAYFRVRAKTTTDPGKWSPAVSIAIPP